MARKKKMKVWDIIVAIFTLLMLMIAIAHPWTIFLAIGGVFAWAWFTTKTCTLCGNVIKRTSYKWKIHGKKKRVCPHCNQRLEREQSRRAFRF